MARRARIGADIGGTFTDIVLLDSDSNCHFGKVSSTPAAPEEAVLTGILDVLKQAGLGVGCVSEVLHGTTVGSNTLLQQAGARCGLITTRGFRDVLEIGRLRTPALFDLTWDKPEPLIARRHRVEVDERVSGSGEIIRPVDIDAVLAAGDFFRREGIESVALCFLNSYRNPENEAAAEEAFRSAFPEIWITASVSVLPEIREYERTSTTAVNAYVLPVLRTYLQRLESGLRRIGVQAPLLVSNSNGGLATAALAQSKPVFFITSGRAAGVVGAGRLGKAMDKPDLIVFDMGGTTASASLIQDGVITRTNDYEFRAGISTPSRFIKAGGYLMRVPTVDVAEVGSGAGSIASIDKGGLLKVGPVSAGADPGPACYGLGGDRPTVTDANAVLGFLPSVLAAGTLRLDIARGRAAIEREIAAPLGLSIEDAAFGIREVVNANMARAIRAVTVERGVDPRDFMLLAFGGSGPVHACDLARVLGIRSVMVPRAPGVFTAMGMLAGSVERNLIRSIPGLLDAFEPAVVSAFMEELARQGTAALREEGYSADRVEFVFEIDLRFRGQDSELPVALPERMDGGTRHILREAFLAAYRGLYGYVSSDRVETVNIRLLARGLGDRLDFRALRSEQLQASGPADTTRRVFVNRTDGWQDVPVIDRAAVNATVPGPAILESADSTIVVPAGARIDLDATRNIVVTGL